MKGIFLITFACLACKIQADTNALSAAGAHINTESQAKNAIVQAGAKGDERFPLRAQDRMHTVCLFRIESSIDGFAKASDRIWQVHFVNFRDEVIRIVWVNAENGNLRLAVPESRQKETVPIGERKPPH